MIKAKDQEEFENLVKRMLEILGQDVNREGLLKTPNRVFRSMLELTNGQNLNAKDMIKDALFETSNKEMVIIKDIPFYSLCEHHLLPFFGKISIAYIPNGKVIGLSKIPRIIEIYSQRLQIQEQLTNQIMLALDEVIEPMGVGILIKARHMCVEMRGVKKLNSQTITSSYCGDFLNNKNLKNEFLTNLK